MDADELRAAAQMTTGGYMRSRSVLAIVLLLTVSIMGIGVAEAAPHTESGFYVPYLPSDRCSTQYLGLNNYFLSGACLPMRSGDSSVTVRVNDILNNKVVARLSWFRYEGAYGGIAEQVALFCGSTVQTIPPGWTHIRVEIASYEASFGECRGPIAPGYIVAEFR